VYLPEALRIRTDAAHWLTGTYANEAAFLAKPLAMTMFDKRKALMDIVNARENWFSDPERFYEEIIEHFDLLYRKDEGFVDCLFNLREILYPGKKFDRKAYRHGRLDKNDNKVTEDADAMKEGLFRQCMKEIDDYLAKQMALMRCSGSILTGRTG
jgi:hypothetical protein